MGLDIKAWSHLKLSDSQEEDDSKILIWRSRTFPNHCELEEGKYEETPATRTFGFRVGPYKYYNEFRKMLTKCTSGLDLIEIWENEEKYLTVPFAKLINFSDCDGIIGPRYSADLYRDFTENREKFIRNLRQEIDFTKETTDPIALEPEFFLDVELGEEDINDYIETYDNFTKAFGLAMKGGIVSFH